MTDDDKIRRMLEKQWQPPAATAEAMAKILQRASATPHVSASPAQGLRLRPAIWLAAASFAAVLIWTGLSRPVSQRPAPMAWNPALDDMVLEYVFSHQSPEELL